MGLINHHTPVRRNPHTRYFKVDLGTSNLRYSAEPYYATSPTPNSYPKGYYAPLGLPSDLCFTYGALVLTVF